MPHRQTLKGQMAANRYLFGSKMKREERALKLISFCAALFLAALVYGVI